MTATARPTRPPRPIVGPSRFPLSLPGWDGVTLTARIHPAATGLLQRTRRGDVVRLVLAIADHEVRRAYVGADRWHTDERGGVEARGTVGRPPGQPLCSPGSLEVLGRSWALSEGADVRPGTRLEVAGLLYVAGGTSLRGEPARPWVVRALRRHVPQGDRVVGVPIRELPDDGPDEDGRAFFAVDLADPADPADPADGASPGRMA
ncbi:hypothetical protein WCD74_15400 [Actinomycetospora sp. OC33-EN08]|uniref:Uncharacterized protein n=1 Tax=Actinomycetospora aurantiaca TaxID=3129233 RepID=A0ABU8MQ79_9PSEU